PPCPLLSPYTTLFRSLRAFEADDHGVNAAQAQDKPERIELLLRRFQRALGKDLHAENAFALLVHRFEAGRHIGGRAVHAMHEQRSEEHTSELQSLAYL